MYEIKITGTTVDEVKSSVFDLSKLLAQQPGAAAPSAILSPAPAPVAPAPVNPTQAAAPTTATTQSPAATVPAPASNPAPVPTAAPTYTQEQLAVAATQLIDAGKRGEVIGLLTAFNVQALTQLPEEQYAAFALALRERGAKI